MKKFSRTKWLAVAGVIVASAVVSNAFALTTFDPACSLTPSNSSGVCGFVGKGDVQTPWGWNNQTLQAKASTVSFTYEAIQDSAYRVTCEFDTGQGEHVQHHVIRTRKAVADAVAYDVSKKDRNNPQGAVTGFKLTGTSLISQDSEGSVPAVGDTCPGNSGLGLVTDVQSDPGSSSSSQTLYASSTYGPQGPTVIWQNGVSVHA